MIKHPTCYKSIIGTQLDVILTNKPKSFQKTAITETDLSDFHMMVSTTFKKTYQKIPPKVISYRCYKDFDDANFCHELDQRLIQGEIYKAPDKYQKLTQVISETLSKFTPVKFRTNCGN